MHGKLHHLQGLVAYHYSPFQFTSALVASPPPFLLLPCWVLLLVVFMKQKQEQQGHWNKSFIMSSSIVFLSVVSAMIWIDRSLYVSL
jgi:hypothetical protein